MQKKVIQIGFMFLLFVVGAIPCNRLCFAQQETIELSTYYPAPYGVYNELKAKKMWIGTRTDHGHVGEFLSGGEAANLLQVGGTDNSRATIYAETNSTVANFMPSAIKGVAKSPSSIAYGVWAETNSADNGSSGLYGISQGATGRTYGVAGITQSTTTNAAGVLGQTDDGKTYGVVGSTTSNKEGSAGVLGKAKNDNAVLSDKVFGVVGIFGSVDLDQGFSFNSNVYGAGIYGFAEDVRDNNRNIQRPTYGVYGETSSSETGSAGVYGRTTLGITYGVYGKTNSSESNSAGVYGENDANNVLTYGLYGLNRSNNLSSTGVRGESIGQGRYGVYGSSSSADREAAGVYGYGARNGVYGVTDGGIDGGTGVYGRSGGNVLGNDRLYGIIGAYGEDCILDVNDKAAGVFGISRRNSGVMYGVYGRVYSTDVDSAGVYGKANLGWAGRFEGGQGLYGSKITAGAQQAGARKMVFDVAEDISAPKADVKDVVVIDYDNDRQVMKSSASYQMVAGVISENPVLHIGKTEGWKPLALAGQVKCKATCENGPIKRGDLLVSSSKPGRAMKGDVDKIKVGMLVGQALQELKEGDGDVIILVK